MSIEIKTTNEAVEAIKKITHEDGMLSVKQVNIIDKACEIIEEKVTELELRTGDLEDELDEFEGENIQAYKDAISDLEDEVIKLEAKLEKSNFPTETLDDENKNKILRNLHHNLNLEQLEEIELRAMVRMPAGIISKQENPDENIRVGLFSSSIKKKKKKIQSRRKCTGELEVFEEMWEEELEKCDPQSPQCWCCNAWLGWEFSVIFFSHLLAKGTYPSLRLVKRNIWIKCFKCHQEWEFGDRSQPKFRSAVKEAQALKLEYYATKHI